MITQTTTILKMVHLLFNQRKKAASFQKKKFLCFKWHVTLKLKLMDMERTKDPSFIWSQLADGTENLAPILKVLNIILHLLGGLRGK